MAFSLHPQISEVLAAAAQAMTDVTMPPPGDVMALRATTAASLNGLMSALPDSPDVEITLFSTTAEDGFTVPMRWYSRRGSSNQAAVVYAHGGGMICGSANQYDRLVATYVQSTGVPFLSVDYRLAPEDAQKGLALDVYASLKWLHDRAPSIGIDPTRMAIMGDSGGGGVAAASSILARDQGIPLARQILIYPMLDDRTTTPDPFVAPFALWNYEFNRTAWSAVLGEVPGGENVSPYRAPARLTDFAGLAPAFIEVGELDIFRDEAVDYARRLWQSGISCELHVHPGGPHAYDLMSPTSTISQTALAARLKVITAL